jgi:hypothetical protein
MWNSKVVKSAKQSQRIFNIILMLCVCLQFRMGGRHEDSELAVHFQHDMHSDPIQGSAKHECYVHRSPDSGVLLEGDAETSKTVQSDHEP